MKKSKLIITVVTLFLFCTVSYSQDYLITNTLPGNDSIAFATLQYGRKDYGFGVPGMPLVGDQTAASIHKLVI
jgi:hypothetical protein